MKKLSGILLTFMLSSPLALANITCTIDGNRIDCTNTFMKSAESYKFSSISGVFASPTKYEMIFPMKSGLTGENSIEIDKNTYEKIKDYMKESK